MLIGWTIPANMVAVLSLLHAVSPMNPHVWVERESFFMGTRLTAAVAAPDRRSGAQAIERLFDLISRTERALSSWDDDSEVGRFNSTEPGLPFPASAELIALLAEVREWSVETRGAFDPVLGALTDVWDMRGEGRVPTKQELQGALEKTGLRHLTQSQTDRTLTRHMAGAWLDAGGFGKGAALRNAAQVLTESGIHRAFLNFGGQVLAIGRPDSAPAWTVAVAHPARRSEPTILLRVADRSLATSSQSERVIEVTGERYGHVIDPRTGEPVPAWGSVTVVAEDPMVADILSTALLVIGAAGTRKWAQDRQDVAVLILWESEGMLDKWWNGAMEPFLVHK
jgi:thiamine biosynthesis lipoprotein